jgi:hypothetical protein
MLSILLLPGANASQGSDKEQYFGMNCTDANIYDPAEYYFKPTSQQIFFVQDCALSLLHKMIKML